MKKLLVLFSILFAIADAKDIVYEGITYDDDTVASLVTVITSTSPIPSIPETTHLYPAQKSLHLIPALAKCNKIIVFDYPKSKNFKQRSLYREYKKNVKKLVRKDPHFADTKLVFCKEWGHLSGTIKEAIQYVKTPFIFLHQHDLQLIEPFDLNGVVATMIANPAIKYVHFSSSPNAPQHWYFGKTATLKKGIFFVPLCLTEGWSDQCHIARTDYYQNFILPQCHQTFMEHIIHPRSREAMKEKGWKAHGEFGSYLYGNLQDGPFIKHTDARNH